MSLLYTKLLSFVKEKTNLTSPFYFLELAAAHGCEKQQRRPEVSGSASSFSSSVKLFSPDPQSKHHHDLKMPRSL